ncbi:MAG: GNAT family N-acetyltransferase [Anaerolineales bacterium]|nr:GNAT family N-acetyltransferase [Anaerolineales bacterium]
MLNIHRAVLDDAAHIAQVHIASWRETYQGLVPDDFLNNLSVERRTAQWAASLLNPADEYHNVLVAEVDQKIIGFANFGNERENDANYRGELFAIYILKSSHNKGIGRKLVHKVAQDLLTRQVESMLVWVLAKNPARRFYERLGAKLLREKQIEIGGVDLLEAAYGWADIRQLANGGEWAENARAANQI